MEENKIYEVLKGIYTQMEEVYNKMEVVKSSLGFNPLEKLVYSGGASK